jgi:hypothetical protein
MAKSFKDIVKGAEKPFGVDGRLAKWNVRKDLLIEGFQNAKSFMTRERHVTLMSPEKKEKLKEGIGKAWEGLNDTFSAQNSNNTTWVVTLAISSVFAVWIGYQCAYGLRTDPKIQLMQYLDNQVITAISPMEAKQMYSDKHLITMNVGGKTYDIIQGNFIELNNKQKSVVNDDMYVIKAIEEAKEAGVKFKYNISKVKDADVSKDSKMVRVTDSLKISQNHKIEEIATGICVGIFSGLVGFFGLLLAYAGLDKLRGY